ncbi:MAG: hypothetical protein GF309_09785 [Candidatus Lokiarchaeota archaeon]|nr:hypothetical protein [Candidatus Lokiarchaeota archaeon]
MSEGNSENGRSRAYQRGYEWFSSTIKQKLDNQPWRRLGIFSYYETPFLDVDNLHLSPEQTMLAMAKHGCESEGATVFILDITSERETTVVTEKGFNNFLQLFNGEFPDSKKLYFGSKTSDRTWLHEYEQHKIPLTWLTKRPNVFAEVLSDASPVGEEIGPGDASFENVAGMIEVLNEKLGPPSLTEEVMGKIKKTEASEYAGEAVGLMTVFVSPTTAVSRGVKYLGKFMNLLKDRRKQEVKEVYEEWEKRVKETFSREHLLNFFDETEEYQSPLVQAVDNEETILIINESRDTLYDLFLPLIFHHLMELEGYVPPHKRKRVAPDADEEAQQANISKSDDMEEVEEEELREFGEELMEVAQGIDEEEAPPDSQDFEGKPRINIFLDSATYLSKLSKSFEFVLSIPETYTNTSLATYFFTDLEEIPEQVQDAVLRFISEKALIFDLHPTLFDLASEGMPVTKKVWLESIFKQIEEKRHKDSLGFLEYNKNLESEWRLHELHKPEPKIVSDIKGWFSR